MDSPRTQAKPLFRNSSMGTHFHIKGELPGDICLRFKQKRQANAVQGTVVRYQAQSVFYGLQMNIMMISE